MAGESHQFEAEVELFGKTSTGFRVPASIIDALGAGKRPPVTVEVSGHTYRSTIGPYADWFFLPLSRANRAAAGVAAGDIVTVAVRHDTEPRVIEVPDEFRALLDEHPQAGSNFDGLSYSHQREYVEWISDAKREETRIRRMDKAIEMLEAGKTQR